MQEKTINITEDGGITKQILQQGEGEEYPQTDQTVDVLYTGKLLDGTVFDSSTNTEEPFQFTIGKGQVIKGWDLGVASMKRREKALLTCSPENAYGKSGSPPTIPPNATLQFEVELLDFFERTKTKWDYSNEERVEMAKKFKDQGNEQFKKGDYKEADGFYNQCIDYVDFDEDINGSIDLRMTTLLNQAAIFSKQKQWEKVIKNCTTVIEKQPANVKAYFRRGNARMNCGQLDEAKQDLLKAQDLDRDNIEVIASLKNLGEKFKLSKEQQKKMWGGIFSQNYYSDQKENAIEFSDPSNPIVFFDIQIGSDAPQRIEMELFKNIVPKTAQNFLKLCTGEKVGSSGKPLHFKNNIFHRLVKEFMLQGGDITNENGTGGESIYGEKFEDENFKAKHTRRGLLSMANSGPNTNGSQFFITFKNTEWLNDKHVVFGAVTKNLEYLDTIEKIEIKGETPSQTIRIVDCGVIHKS